MSPGRAASPVRPVCKAPVPTVANRFTSLSIDPIIAVYIVIIGAQI